MIKHKIEIKLKLTSMIGVKRVSFSIRNILEWPRLSRALVKFPAAGPISITALLDEGADPTDTIFSKKDETMLYRSIL